MANRNNTFLLKRSSVPGKVPTAGSLLLGEIALNTADAILYASGTTSNSILPIGWDRIARTGDTVTGNFNFFGDIKISGSSLPNGYALAVTGDTNFVGDVYVTGDLTYNGSLLVTGGTVIQSGLTANTIYTDYIDFNTNYTGATLPAGRLQWDDGNGTLVLGLKGGISDMEIGLENMALCYNDEATTLTAGTVVYVSGSQGNRPSVKRAIATSDGYSVTTLGVVSETIASGAEGFVTTFGMVNNLNTVGYSGGTPIWLSPTDAGGYTTVKPQAPNHTVLIGYIVRVHASVGSVFVHVSNGWEIDELHDVRINDKVQGDLLTLSAYNGSDVWVNSKILNGSYTMTGLTVQGSTSSDLVRITQTGTGNAFVVEDTTNPDATQFVIDTTGKVGIGLTNPEYILDIVSSGGTTSFENISRFRTIDSTDYLSITNAVSTDGSFNPILRSFNNTNISPNFYIQSVISPSVDTGINPLLVIQGRVSTDPGNVTWSGVTTRPILRVANNTSNLIEVTSNGNFGIGTITPTQKLDVRGNALVSSGLTATTVSATTYQNLPTDVRVTGATYSNNTFTYTNNTGGTFNVLFDTVTGLTVNGNVTITGNTNISGSSTTAGDVHGYSLVSTQSVGDEGGEVRLSTAQTNSSLSGGSITFDVYQNRLRFFESGGSNRGVYIDLTAASTGVGTNLLSGGGGEINTASNLGAGTGLFAQKVAADLQFKSLTSTGGTVTISNDANTVNLEVIPASNFTGGTVTGATNFTNGLTANTFNIGTIGSGTPINNICIDASGNIVTGNTGSGIYGGNGTVPLDTTISVNGNLTFNGLDEDTKLILKDGNNGGEIHLFSDGNAGQSAIEFYNPGGTVISSKIQNAGGDTRYISNNRDLLFTTHTGTTTLGFFVEAGTGNMGIGTTSPTQKLDVVGNTNIRGTLNVSGNTTLNNITATTVSATTYYNLPTDVFTTGGTYSDGTATFTNNTGGTFTVTGIGSTGSNVGSGTTIFSGTSGSTLIFKSLTSTGSTISINNDSTTIDLGTNIGVKPIPISTSSVAIGTGSNDYYLNFKVPHDLTIVSITWVASSTGSDAVRYAIFRGQDTTATLVGQTAAGTLSSALTTRTITAESGQNLSFKAGEWMVIGVAVGGTTTNLYGMSCPVTNLVAWTNTTDSAAGGFPTNPRSKAATRTSIPSVELNVV